MNISRTIWAVIILATTASCSQASKPTAAKISGKSSIKKQWIYLVQPEPWVVKAAIIDSCKSDEDGNFLFNTDIKEMGEYLVSGRGFFLTTVFLVNGYDMTVDIQGRGQGEKKSTFTGKGSEVNSFWQNMSRRYYKSGGYNKMYKKLVAEQEPLGFLRAWDVYAKEQKTVADSFVKAAKPDKFFRNWLESFVTYGTASKKLTYLFHKPRFSKSKDPYLKVEDNYYTFLNEMDIDKMPAVENSAYNDFIYFYAIDFRARNASEGEDGVVSAVKHMKENLSEEVSARATANILKDFINSASSRTDYDKLRSLMEEFKTWESATPYVAFLDYQFKQKAVLAPGSPAPNFTFRDLEGQEVSLTEFKGKVVVIDFWGTWCGPCKGQLPFSKKIEEHYADRDDLVFVFVALERGGREPWKQYVTSNDLPGVQLFSNNSDKQLYPYKIESVPRYVIVDKDGTIYDAYAARPSGNMQQQIAKVLEL